MLVISAASPAAQPLAVVAVPEPGTFALMFVALWSAAIYRRFLARSVGVPPAQGIRHSPCAVRPAWISRRTDFNPLERNEFRSTKGTAATKAGINSRTPNLHSAGLENSIMAKPNASWLSMVFASASRSAGDLWQSADPRWVQCAE